MRNKKVVVVLGMSIVLGLSMLGLISTNYVNPVIQTSAQQGQRDPFALINEKAKENKSNPSFEKSREIADLLVENLSVLEIPEYLRTPISEQVANATMNGASTIDENNIVATINNLADQSSAPAYAYTNTEQVRVVRTFLHSLIPDVVTLNGTMTDLEAFAVFIGTLSQKVDNDAFMVTPAEFTISMSNPANQPFPGSSASVTPNAEAVSESVKSGEMLGVVNSFVGSKNMLASQDIILMIGIN